MPTFHSDLTGDTAIHQIMYVQSSDPGAVGAYKMWLDTTYGAVLKERNAGDSAWTVRVLASRRAHGATGASETVDWSEALAHHLTIDAACAVTFSNPTAGATYVLEILQDGTGGWAVTLPTITWPDGTPTLTTTASKLDVFALYYTGTIYIGKVVGQNL
jgi:hypothetical protein